MRKIPKTEILATTLLFIVSLLLVLLVIWGVDLVKKDVVKMLGKTKEVEERTRSLEEAMRELPVSCLLLLLTDDNKNLMSLPEDQKMGYILKNYIPIGFVSIEMPEEMYETGLCFKKITRRAKEDLDEKGIEYDELLFLSSTRNFVSRGYGIGIGISNGGFGRSDKRTDEKNIFGLSKTEAKVIMSVSLGILKKR